MKVRPLIYIPFPERLLNEMTNKPPYEMFSRATPLAQEIFSMLEKEDLKPKFALSYLGGKTSGNTGYLIRPELTISLWSLIKEMFTKATRSKVQGSSNGSD